MTNRGQGRPFTFHFSPFDALNFTANLMPLATTHYATPDQTPKATICVVGGTNIAHALARSPHMTGSFTIDTPFGVSPVIYFGETSGVPFFHITLHGSTELSGVAEQEVLFRVWSALHQLVVSD